MQQDVYGLLRDPHLDLTAPLKKANAQRRTSNIQGRIQTSAVIGVFDLIKNGNTTDLVWAIRI